MMNYLIVDMRRRLPDINRMRDLPPEYSRYGRLAILNTGGLWMATEIMSSHPPTTRDGFYWALDREETVLYLSPRGASLDWETMITDEIIRTLARKLGLSRKYRTFKRLTDD